VSIEENPVERCVIVVDQALPPGRAANAAAVLALTLGAMMPALVGDELVDADGYPHPGLIPIGLAILRASSSDLTTLRARALDSELGVIDFPAFGQQTNDYHEVRSHVARTPTTQLEYLGLALHGSRRAVTKLTGNFPLLR
jgi:hypothetical protein